MKIMLSHSGKQHSYKVAKAMQDLGVLDKFYTSSYVKSKALQAHFVNTKNNYFTRRFESGLYGSKINANWRFEVKEVLYRKLYKKSRKTQNAIYERDMKFDAYVAAQIEKRALKEDLKGMVFWGFQGSCYQSLQAAKNAGMVTVIELATAHVVAAKRILGEEQELHPEWADSIDNLVFPEVYEKRLIQEPHLADYVVAASQFTASTLKEVGIKKENILYLPLGVDVTQVQPRQDNGYNKPIKILYAGTVTQRKGIKYLLEAIKDFDPSLLELHIYGHIQGDGEAFKSYKDKVIYHGPVSQNELFTLYKNFDALVLPSVFEGFGLVIVEAMAAGLPVITTSHTFGAELIEDEINGFMVNIRSTKDLTAVFNKLLQLSPENFKSLSDQAQKAVSAVTWEVYQKKLEKLIDNHLAYKC